ncbi:N-chimaerin [Toxorhynchites rutilus septentrionalis]|uniref:N-chimaerin n=1 Tax=Toxorhynchites rutilus septentrionalis TaxID=329112 RepID=UPI00247AA1EA|nr:N-chimaerin [Toxorhynchites rutilus septentrionalis]XP_055638604.1 N-chimaerin [Toxorhynchites rutilus septentrionalis]XP_055638605.1 N-chimaerin [Toxorhynchites rutilus septentrionalis]XP_055638606.1 N-chimaerin [Toxorhynchites rutilus septentrionalis]
MAKETLSQIDKVWKPELYKIQLEAPTPKPIYCDTSVDQRPNFYDSAYHGIMDHHKSEKILEGKPDGSYLIRRSPGATDYWTLSLRFGRKTKHFKIYYSPDKGHFLRENFKKFDTVHDLVADGLVDFYMRIHAGSIIQQINCQTKNCYEQSPYMTLNRRKLRALSNELRKSSKLSMFNDDMSTTAITGAKADDPLAMITDVSDCGVLPEIYEKNHNFKTHTFKGLNWCEFCANFLWGFTSQGVKCEDCGFVAHVKCSEIVPAKCVPDLKRLRGIFGVDLTTLVTAHKCKIPFIVKKCVEEVERHGMLQEGIYRISGFADEIDALKMTLDKDGEKADMTGLAYSNINVISGVLKLYLRLLPVPLITFHSYSKFMQSMAHKTIGEQVISLRDAMKQLPQAHFNCLKYILEHLNRVASYHAINKMNESNLATVFAPTLIATPQHMTDLSQEINMLTSMITNCNAIFL